MSETQIRVQLAKLGKPEMVLLLASYLAREQKGYEVTDERILRQTIEDNFIDQMPREDLRIEIINSLVRLGIA